MAEMAWYYARNDQQFGPVSAKELKQLVDAGRLAPDDLLWREGMDAWTTAINLRGLFADEQPGTVKPLGSEAPALRRNDTPPAGSALPSVLRTTQIILWTMCVLVILVGIVLFTKAFLAADSPGEEAAAGAVFSTFFIGAYLLARCGEKLSRLLLDLSARRRN